jgi:GTP-binding protein
MLPVIALIGRPNVGKSTLFNRLTGSRDALVADEPGLTRDRQYGTGHYLKSSFIVMDTGGLVDDSQGIDALIAGQVQQAMDEADLLLFLVDTRSGLTAADEIIARQLRQKGKPVMLVINKAEGIDVSLAAAEFHALGMGEPCVISASHGDGIQHLLDCAFQSLPAAEAAAEVVERGIVVAVIGRPNVGKSTLINRMLGEDRVVVCDMPGTTRDSIYIPLERDGCTYTLVDTAGVRRRARLQEKIEKFSVIKTLQAIETSNVVIMMMDASEGITDQDLTILGHILDAGRSLLIAFNKWDGLDTEQRTRVKRDIDRKLGFVDFAETQFISALHGTGVGKLFDVVQQAYKAAMIDISTPELSTILQDIVDKHAPPLVRGRRIKLRYAHQGGRNPPVIIIHGNQVEHVPESYRRYLVNAFRKALRLKGTPLQIQFKRGRNPYQHKKNVLTDKQLEKRRRGRRRMKRWQ